VINRGGDHRFDIGGSGYVCLDEESIASGRSDLPKHIFAALVIAVN